MTLLLNLEESDTIVSVFQNLIEQGNQHQNDTTNHDAEPVYSEQSEFLDQNIRFELDEQVETAVNEQEASTSGARYPMPQAVDLQPFTHFIASQEDTNGSIASDTITNVVQNPSEIEPVYSERSEFLNQIIRFELDEQVAIAVNEQDVSGSGSRYPTSQALDTQQFTLFAVMDTYNRNMASRFNKWIVNHYREIVAYSTTDLFISDPRWRKGNLKKDKDPSPYPQDIPKLRIEAFNDFEQNITHIDFFEIRSAPSRHLIPDRNGRVVFHLILRKSPKQLRTKYIKLVFCIDGECESELIVTADEVTQSRSLKRIQEWERARRVQQS